MGFWAMLSLSNRLGALALNWYGELTVFPEMSITFCPSLTTSKLILNLRRMKFLLFLSMKSLKLVVLDEFVQLGGGVEGHLGVGLPLDSSWSGLVLPEGLVGPHGLAIFESLNLDGSAEVQFDIKLVGGSLEAELVVLVSGAEVSLGDLAPHDRVLGPQPELGSLDLNLTQHLKHALGTLLDQHVNLCLVSSALHADLAIVLDTPDIRLDDDVHVLA